MGLEHSIYEINHKLREALWILRGYDWKEVEKERDRYQNSVLRYLSNCTNSFLMCAIEDFPDEVNCVGIDFEIDLTRDAKALGDHRVNLLKYLALLFPDISGDDQRTEITHPGSLANLESHVLAEHYPGKVKGTFVMGLPYQKGIKLGGNAIFSDGDRTNITVAMIAPEANQFLSTGTNGFDDIFMEFNALNKDCVPYSEGILINLGSERQWLPTYLFPDEVNGIHLYWRKESEFSRVVQPSEEDSSIWQLISPRSHFERYIDQLPIGEYKGLLLYEPSCYEDTKKGAIRVIDNRLSGIVLDGTVLYEFNKVKVPRKLRRQMIARRELAHLILEKHRKRPIAGITQTSETKEIIRKLNAGFVHR